MADQDDSDRTEEATPLRREEFRKRGQVAQTRELASVFLIFSLIICFYVLGRFAFDQFQQIFQEVLGRGMLKTVRHDSPLDVFKFSIAKAGFILAPVLFICLIASFFSSVLQIGILNNEEALGFKWERLDPVSGFKRIFSIRSLVEGFKSVVKICLIGGVTYLVLKNEIAIIPILVNYSVGQLLGYVGVVMLKLLTAVVAFMAGVAGLDYLFQRWELEKSMMMTRQEVKDELKSREGDPMIRARIRRSQREMAQKRMMQEVPKADVVVTNPTHIAVAIKYDMSTMAAPKIVAMGAGYIAEKIKDLARKHNVPIMENKPLARTIFKTLKIGQLIPRELYTAVAEVLSYVFKLKKKGLS
jgi:flagellar biosynthesis protein FlhB